MSTTTTTSGDSKKRKTEGIVESGGGREINGHVKEGLANGHCAVEFPFDVVVITSPDEDAAQAALDGIIKSSLRETGVIPASVPVISTSDPLGTRMGSGGGTIAAYDMALRTFAETGATAMDVDGEGKDEPTRMPTVLIIHAGGDSSRCPTQMILGKAWTSLPVRTGTGRTQISNPTAILIELLVTILRDVPPGAVVVAASDVLITLPDQQKVDFSVLDGSDVVGLAVPTPLHTAKNHGVFVLPAQSNDAERSQIRSVKKFLQKPPVKEMQSSEGASFRRRRRRSSNAGGGEVEEAAWIDTGVILFQPDAAKSFRTLFASSDAPLRCCTLHGLQQMHQEAAQASSLKDFAKSNTAKVELYTHLLMALRTSSSAADLQEYLQRHSSDGLSPDVVLKPIFNALSPHSLKVFAVTDDADEEKSPANHNSKTAATFVHLGTTRELMDYMVCGSLQFHQSSSIIINREQSRMQRVGNHLQLTTKSAIFFDAPLKTASRSIVLNTSLQVHRLLSRDSFAAAAAAAPSAQAAPARTSVVGTSVVADQTNEASIQIGRDTIIEHTYLASPMGITIGDECVISGIRGRSSKQVNIPSEMCLQKVPLDNTSATSSTQQFLLVYLGVNDAIKSPCQQIFGLPLEDLLHFAHLRHEDIWDPDVKTPTIWTAKLHVVQNVSSLLDGESDDPRMMELDLSPLDWIQAAKRYLSSTEDDADAIKTKKQPTIDDIADGDEIRKSLQRWKELERLPLNQVRSKANARMEHEYRGALFSSYIPECKSYHLENIRQILVERRHEQCLLDYVVDSAVSARDTCDLQSALTTLDSVAQKALDDSQYDICGRVLMVSRNLFSKIATDLSELQGVTDSDQPPSMKRTRKNVDGTNGAVFNGEISELRKLLGASSVLASTEKLEWTSNVREAFQRLVSTRNDALFQKDEDWMSPKIYEECANAMEDAAQIMTGLCVSSSFETSRLTARAKSDHETMSNGDCNGASGVKPAADGKWIVASAPARIDLAGGWSDTPPVSYEHGGAVACLAVTVDGRKPLSCRCRMIQGKGILLRTESRKPDGTLLYGDETRATKVKDLSDYREPTASCALLKCALICLGLVPLDVVMQSEDDLQPFINDFCGGGGDDVGLEVVSTSLLPRGSGMGGSSILAGCIVAAVAECVGLDFWRKESGNGNHDCEHLVHAVLQVEQLLSTGGGWQDQIGGLIGGLKIGTSLGGKLPLRTAVEKVPLSREVESRLSQRLSLLFTGQPRLAKDILQKVLRRWASREPEIVTTVRALVEGAHSAAEATKPGRFEDLGHIMNSYWTQKKAMAGEDSGAEPVIVNQVLKALFERQAIEGGTLCGAGGGGFLVLLAKPSYEGDRLRHLVDSLGIEGTCSFAWHDVAVCSQGLTVTTVGGEANNTVESFDPSWHNDSPEQ